MAAPETADTTDTSHTGDAADTDGDPAGHPPVADPDPVADPPVVDPPPTSMGRADKVPVRMLSDRILVQLENGEGERRSSGGILIPATAHMGKRLAWAEVRAVGPNVRSVQDGDKVLFNPEDVYEVEVRGEMFVILRERDIHAMAAERLDEGSTGLYL